MKISFQVRKEKKDAEHHFQALANLACWASLRNKNVAARTSETVAIKKGLLKSGLRRSNSSAGVIRVKKKSSPKANTNEVDSSSVGDVTTECRLAIVKL